jgi:hypothetical protein
MSKWIERILLAVLLLAGAGAVFGWYVYATARCEGFDCIGLGVVIMFTIGVESLAAAAGALLIWLRRRRDAATRALWALEIALLLPIAWFVLRVTVRAWQQ